MPAAVDWGGLFHAYGRAGDVPARLAALVGTDRDAAFDASVFVIQKLFANGMLTPATAPAMHAVAELLRNPALGAGDDGIRDALLWFLGDIARVTTSVDIESLRAQVVDETAALAWAIEQIDDPDRPSVFDWRTRGLPGTLLLDRALVDCFDLLPDMFAAVWPIPSWWPRWSRVEAAAAAVMLVRHRHLADRRVEVIAHHEAAAEAAENRRECASYVLGLGELGVAPRAWLRDPRFGVRVCAALAPALAADDDAVAVLVEAAEHPRAFDHGFSEPFVPPAYRLMRPAHLGAAWPPETLIRVVCARVADFARLVRAAVAAVDLRDVYRPTPKFGPCLRVAFPNGPPGSGEGTAEQGAFARAIADRDELWDGTYHGVAEMFSAAALPTQRDEWRRLAALPTGDTTYESVRIVAFDNRMAVRRYPWMYLDVPRTDPGLTGRLAEVIACHAGTSVQIGPEYRVTVDVTTAVDDPAELDSVATSRALGDPRYVGLAVAAALSLWVEFDVWKDGVAYRREYVDGIATGPMETVGSDNHADGYRLIFDLDQEWLPPRPDPTQPQP